MSRRVEKIRHRERHRELAIIVNFNALLSLSLSDTAMACCDLQKQAACLLDGKLRLTDFIDTCHNNHDKIHISQGMKEQSGYYVLSFTVKLVCKTEDFFHFPSSFKSLTAKLFVSSISITTALLYTHLKHVDRSATHNLPLLSLQKKHTFSNHSRRRRIYTNTVSMANSGRPARTLHKSRRARESDEVVPGIDSTIARMNALSPSLDDTDTTLPSLDISLEARADTSHMNQTPTIRVEAPLEDSYDEQHEQNILKVEQELNVDVEAEVEASTTALLTNKKGKTKSKRGRQARTPSKRSTKKQIQEDDEEADLLRDLHLAIYDWPDPQPKPKLLAFHKEWKLLQDQQEAKDDRDEELDDWYEKSGRSELYSGGDPMQAYYYSIARTFILRAKRAFRAGKTWSDFENSEMTLDSTAKARAFTDSHRRRLHLREALDNDVRLAVFEQIRKRLCEEIWLEDYEETQIRLHWQSMQAEHADRASMIQA